MKRKLFFILFIFPLILNFIPIGYSGVYLQFDRNEYYETGTVAYNMEDMINSTHLYDFALNDNHGEKSSGLTFTDGYFGEALTNFGLDKNVTIPDTPITNQDYTVMAWIYPNTLDGTPTIFRGFNVPSGAWDLLIYSATNTYRWRAGLDSLYSISNAQTSKWVHITVVHEPSNATHRVRMYLNGTLDNYRSTWRHRDLDGHLEIGCTVPYASFNGIIDEVRIFVGEARTQTEIQTDLETSMAMKLVVEDLEPNEAIVQLWYINDTLFEQQTADSNGEVEYNVFVFSNKTSEYQGVINVYIEDIQYFGYVSVLNWGDIYIFRVLSAYEDLFIQLFYGEGAWLGILIMILGSLFGLILYKYTAIIFSVIFILLGLQYFTEFSSGSSDLMWFWVFCWIMPIFLIIAMLKIKRR